MSLNLFFNISRKFLQHTRWQSILVILTFTIGIATNIFIGNLIGSIENDLINRTVNSQFQIEITDEVDGYINNYREIFPVLDQYSEIKSYCKILSGHAFIVENNETTRDVMIRGYSNIAMSLFNYNIINDRFEGTIPQEANEVIIGELMADKLDLTLGNSLNLTSNPFIPIFRNLIISGIYSTGQSQLDDNWIISQFITSGFVLNAVDMISSISIQLLDPMESSSIADRLETTMAREDLVINDWQVSNSALLDTIQAQSISTLIVQGFILLAVSISLGSMLNVMVTNSLSDFAILEVMGITPDEKTLIVFIQSLILGLFGILFGLIMGLIFISLFNYFGGDDVVIITFRPIFTALSILISIIATNIAAVLPAIKAKKLTLISVLRRV